MKLPLFPTTVVVFVASALVPLMGRSSWAADPAEHPITRIGVGSCIRQDRPQPIWDAVLKEKPEVFVFLGDNIYADTVDMELMRAKYALLAANPGFAKLRESCRALATWDDHDYGANDAGADYAMKAQSREIFLDFWGVPDDSLRREHEGVYDAVTIGPPGKRVQFILLDTRTFRGPLTKKTPDERLPKKGPYKPTGDASTTLLGDAQWTWLAERLREPAEVRLLCSSIQVIADDHGWEKWGNFPHERKRLLDLIRETKAGGVIALSGDRHAAEISKLDDGSVPYPLYDLTASSLNQTLKPDDVVEPNRFRLGKVYRGTNFGMVRIEWGEEPTVSLEIRGEEEVETRRLSLRELRVR